MVVIGGGWLEKNLAKHEKGAGVGLRDVLGKEYAACRVMGRFFHCCRWDRLEGGFVGVIGSWTDFLRFDRSVFGFGLLFLC